MLPLGSSHVYGGLAQLARAPDLHSGGQRFDSVILHTLPIERGRDLDLCVHTNLIFGPVTTGLSPVAQR